MAQNCGRVNGLLTSLVGGKTKGGLRENGHAAIPANPPSAQSYGWQTESARRGKPISTFASPRAARNKRVAIRRRLGGTFAGLLRSGAHELAPWSCMVSRLL